MSTGRILAFAATALIVILSLGLSSEIVAQEGSVEEDGFEVGGSCASLAYLGAGQLKAFLSSGYSDDFHSFCYPEEPYSCSDYTSYLKGLGRMTTGEDGYHCSLQLQF
jgi:hypothetical protein